MPPPRFMPDVDFPPYTFVPGRTPHPIRDPAGHLFGKPIEIPPPLDPRRWGESRDYLHGLDLFNHGYYWEAHEVWEGLWRAAGRAGMTADFLKGLIKLAAAGVKVRQGQPRGVASHAAGASELFRDTARQLGGDNSAYLGLFLNELLTFAGQIETQAATVGEDEDKGVKIVFPFVLRPTAGNGRADATL